MIYHVYANRSNIGDWLSAKGIQALLGAVDITECFCDEPFIAETIDTLSKAGDQDLIVVGGGGLVMDYFVPFWKAFQPIADKVPFAIWGVGCCDLKDEASLPPKQLMEDIVRKSRLCVVRDELTRSFLSGCILPQPVACPSINVIPAIVKPGNDVLHVNNYTTVGAEAYEVMREITMSFAEDLPCRYLETNNRLAQVNENALAAILKQYEQSKIVVSSALHGCIIAAAMGIKVVAVSGDRKIEHFMETAGLGEWVLSNNEADQLSVLLAKVDTQRNVQARLNEVRLANQNVAESIKQMLSEKDKN